MLFSVGGLFALYEAYHKWHDPHGIDDWQWVPIVVLVASIGLESFSFRTAIKESLHHKGSRSWVAFVRTAKAPELPVILLEDLAALLGLVFALFGVSMTLATGNGRWDAAGTGTIGLLLVTIAVILAVEMKSLLLGESANLEAVVAIEAALVGAGVVRVIHLRDRYLWSLKGAPGHGQNRPSTPSSTRREGGPRDRRRRAARARRRTHRPGHLSRAGHLRQHPRRAARAGRVRLNRRAAARLGPVPAQVMTRAQRGHAGSTQAVLPNDAALPSDPSRKERIPMTDTMRDTDQPSIATGAGFTDFKVRDLSLAEAGRHQIRLAEHEMPGLMSLRQEYAAAQPLKGARIMGSLRYIDCRTAVP